MAKRQSNFSLATALFLAAVLTPVFFGTTASAQLIGPDHVNDNNPGPQGEGFLLVGGEPLGVAVGPSADFPSGAWNMGTYGLQRYKSETDPIDGDFTFTLRGLVSYVQNPNQPGTSPEDLRAAGLGFVVDAVENDNPRYSFGWNEQLTRVIMQHDAGSGLEAQYFALDATQVHTYQLIRQSGTANFYVDGNQVIQNIDNRGMNFGQGLDNHTGLFFGSLSSNPASQSDSKWDLIRLEQGVNIYDPNAVPETTFTWGSSESGQWSSLANWQPVTDGPPDNSNETAIFGDAIGSDSRTVFTDSDVTINAVQFENAMGGSYAVAGAGSVNLASTADGTDTLPTLSVTGGGSHQFQAMVRLQNDATVTVNSGSALTFTNGLDLNGHTLTKMGPGSIAVNNDFSASGGTLACTEGACTGNADFGSALTFATAVPEPTTAALALLGVLGTLCLVRRRPAELIESVPLAGGSSGRLAGTLCALVLLTSWASAQVVLPKHTDDRNPLLEGFTTQNTIDGMSDNGSWKMTVGGAARYIAEQGPANSVDRTFTATGYLESASGNNNIGMVLMYEPDADQSAQLAFLEDGTGIWDRGAGPGVNVYNVDTSVEHTYQMVYSGGEQKAYVDGNFAFDLTIAESVGLDNFPGGYFVGSASSASPSVSSWNLWQVEEGIHLVTPIVDTTFAWNASGAGAWLSTDNWAGRGAPPDASSDTAVFGNSIGSDARTVFTDSAITVNSVQFENSTGGSYIVAGTGSINLGENSEGSVAPTLSVSNQGNHEFQALVNLQHDTTATIEVDSTLKFTNALNFGGNAFTKTGAGTVMVNNIAPTVGGTFHCDGGTCGGIGKIGGDLNSNGGTVAPGNATGRLTVDGNFTQGASSTLALEIGGLNEGNEHDKLVVTSAADLAGVVAVELTDGFAPSSGATFDVLDFGTFVDNGFQFDFSQAGGAASWNTSQFSTNGTLSFASGAGVLGDFSQNGVVDAADYVVWRDNFGTNNTLPNDGGLPLPVGNTHYDLWKLNFGNSGTGASAAAAVPEPATCGLLLLGLLSSILGGYRNGGPK